MHFFYSFAHFHFFAYAFLDSSRVRSVMSQVTKLTDELSTTLPAEPYFKNEMELSSTYSTYSARNKEIFFFPEYPC